MMMFVNREGIWFRWLEKPSVRRGEERMKHRNWVGAGVGAAGGAGAGGIAIAIATTGHWRMDGCDRCSVAEGSERFSG